MVGLSLRGPGEVRQVRSIIVAVCNTLPNGSRFYVVLVAQFPRLGKQLSGSFQPDFRKGVRNYEMWLERPRVHDMPIPELMFPLLLWEASETRLRYQNTREGDFLTNFCRHYRECSLPSSVAELGSQVILYRRLR